MYIVRSLIFHEKIENGTLMLSKTYEEAVEFLNKFTDIYCKEYGDIVNNNPNYIEILNIKSNVSKIHVLEFHKIILKTTKDDEIIGKLDQIDTNYCLSKEEALVEAIKLFIEFSADSETQEVLKMKKNLGKKGEYIITNTKNKSFSYRLKIYKIHC